MCLLIAARKSINQGLTEKARPAAKERVGILRRSEEGGVFLAENFFL